MNPVDELSRACQGLKQAALNYANATGAPGGNGSWRHAQAQALYDAAHAYVEAKAKLHEHLYATPLPG